MGSINAWVDSFKTYGYHTEAANTAIDETVDGKEGKRLALIYVNYLAAATAHSLSIMYPGEGTGCRLFCDGGAAAAQKVIDVTVAPKDPAGNAIAASDIVAYVVTGGTWEWNVVASLSTKAITHSTNVAIAVLDGAKYMSFGVAADNSRQVISCTASVVTSFDSLIFTAPQKGDPIYVSSNNATNAGFLNGMVWAYINK